MSVGGSDGALLIAPHRFQSIEGERDLAAAQGIELIEAGDPEEFWDSLARARIIMMTPYATLDAASLGAAGRCEAVVRYGVGVDNIDVDAATSAGIPVAYVPDASVEEVAMHAVAMALALSRHLPAAGRAIRAGDWTSNELAGAHRFSSMTAGVIGLGRIGALTAKYLDLLGATVVAHDPALTESPFQLVELNELFERADIVSLHLPLIPETANLLSRERIATLKPGAIVINVSRGGLIDEIALAEALAEGRVGGAGLDVFSEEPLDKSHPILNSPNTVLTPHVAWRSEESARDLQLKAVGHARAFLEGERPSNVLNPSAWETP